jgi:hypothetical protein
VNQFTDAFVASANKVTAVDGTARTITMNVNAAKSGERSIGLLIRKAPDNPA